MKAMTTLPQVDDAEVHFLILHFLASGPCQAAARALEQDAAANSLLPTRIDFAGDEHQLDHDALRQQYQHVPPAALAELLRQTLAQKAAAGLGSLSSLLHPGAASVVQSVAAAPPLPPLPPWLRPPHHTRSQFQKLQLRSLHGSAPLRSARRLLPPPDLARRVQHLQSMRGHQFAVYCIAFDKRGRHIITGSDDTFVKVWSADTGLLQCSCRGHMAEITDLSVSADNSLFASASNDRTVRTWSLQAGEVGELKAVLTGHTNLVSFIEFCPTLPRALLSCSFDGTCRIWNAADAAVPAVVLEASATFGPVRNITRLGLGLRNAAGGAAPLGSRRGEAPIEVDSDSQPSGLDDANELPSLLVCGFSRDGSYFAAGGNDCSTYVWHWDLAGAGITAGPPVSKLIDSVHGQSSTTAAIKVEQPSQQHGPESAVMPSAADHASAATMQQESQPTGAATATAAAAAAAAGKPPALAAPGSHWDMPKSAVAAPLANGDSAHPAKPAVAPTIASESAMAPPAAADGIASAAPMESSSGQLARKPGPEAGNGAGVPAQATAAHPAAVQQSAPPALAAAEPTAAAAPAEEETAAPEEAGTSPAAAVAITNAAAGQPMAVNIPLQMAAPEAAEINSAAAAPPPAYAAAPEPVAMDSALQETATVEPAETSPKAAPFPADAAAAAAAAVPMAIDIPVQIAASEAAEFKSAAAAAPEPTAMDSALQETAAIEAAQTSPEAAPAPADAAAAAPMAVDTAADEAAAPQAADNRLATAAAPEATQSGAPASSPRAEAVTAQPTAQPVELDVAAADAVAGSAEAASDAAWPQPTEVCSLEGHKNDVLLLLFSPDGEGIATGSKDGHVRIWRKERKRGKRPALWAQKHTLASPPQPEEQPALGRRRRAPPMLRVNQIAWTNDSSRVVASVTDNSLRVWEARHGMPQHTLVGHLADAYVLESHPWEPRILMSAGYDGRIILWDIVAGSQLASFSTQDTCPSGRRWVDAIQMLDGHFSPDGLSLAVTDVAGQVHIYGLGGRDSLRRAPYDQFFLPELQRHQPEQQQAPLEDALLPLRPATERLCDSLGDPYPEPFQTAYQTRHTAALVTADFPLGMRPGIHQNPPTISAAAWLAQENGGGEAAIQSAILRAQERALAAELAEAPPQPARPRRGRRAVVETDSDSQAPEPQLEAQHDYDEFVPSDESEDDEMWHGSDSDYQQSLQQSPRRSRAQRQPGVGRQARRGPATRAAAREPSQPSSSAGVERQPGVTTRRSAAAGASAARVSSRELRKRTRDQAKLGDSDSEAGSASGSEDEFDPEEKKAQGELQRLERLRRREARAEAAAERYQQRASTAQQPRRQVGGGSRARAASDANRPRPAASYSWLKVEKQQPGVYVPQLGDEVVYLREGHAKFLTDTSDKRQPPWEMLIPTETSVADWRMRPAEPCTVTHLEYAISSDGDDYTIAKVKLRLTDKEDGQERTPLDGREFEVTLPAPGHAEFVVPLARFEAAISREWMATPQDCQVWFADAGGGEGSWWKAKIMVDGRNEQGVGVLADPWSCGGLWERFGVEWHPEHGGADNAEDFDRHSPWELFDVGVTTQEALEELPQLSTDVRDRMATALTAAINHNGYEAFLEAPPADFSMPLDNNRVVYYNRCVPLPLGLVDISIRLATGYYRQPAALRHDTQLLASNARLFNADDAPIVKVANELVEELTEQLEGRPAPRLQEEAAAAAVHRRRSTRERRRSRPPGGEAADGAAERGRGAAAPSRHSARLQGQAPRGAGPSEHGRDSAGIHVPMRSSQRLAEGRSRVDSGGSGQDRAAASGGDPGPSGGGRYSLRQHGPAPRHSAFEELQSQQRAAQPGGQQQQRQRQRGREQGQQQQRAPDALPLPDPNRRSLRAHPPRNYAEDAELHIEEEPPSLPASQPARRHSCSGGSGAAAPHSSHGEEEAYTSSGRLTRRPVSHAEHATGHVSAAAEDGGHGSGSSFQEAYTSSGRLTRRPASYAEHAIQDDVRRAEQRLQPGASTRHSTRSSASAERGAAAAIAGGADAGGVAVSRSGRPIKRHNYAEDEAGPPDDFFHAAPAPPPQQQHRRRQQAGSPIAGPSPATRATQQHAVADGHPGSEAGGGDDMPPLFNRVTGSRSSRGGQQRAPPVAAQLRLGSAEPPSSAADEAAGEAEQDDGGAGLSAPSAAQRPTRLRIKLKRHRAS